MNGLRRVGELKAGRHFGGAEWKKPEVRRSYAVERYPVNHARKRMARR